MNNLQIQADKDSIREQFAFKGMKSTIAGIVVSILLAAVKGVAGVLGNSYALVADAIESTSDVFTSIIVLIGLRIAAKPADQDHPYGHGKAEPIAAVVVASGLFLAAVIIIIQSIYEIITPHHAPEQFTLFVLLGVVLVKETLFRFVIKVGSSLNSRAVINDAWHHRSDAITSAAVFIGISIALIGGPGYEEADDYAALFASAIILFNAFRLWRPALLELTDVAPPKEKIDKVRNEALKVDGVRGLDKCYLRKMGFDYFVDIHVLVDGNKTVSEGHEIAHRVKASLMKQYRNISDVLVHIEPYHNDPGK
ncbi:MAG: cation diffusion facilitator family transporter [Ignavibacteriaceae bacterium]